MTHVDAPKPLREEPSGLGRALELAARKTAQVNPAAQARVWKKLSRPADRWHAKHLWLAGATALAAAFAMIFWSTRPHLAPAQGFWLEELAGSVKLDGLQAALRPGAMLPAHAQLVIGGDGAAVIALDSLRLVLAPGARLRLDDPQKPALLQGLAAVQILGERRFTMAAGAYTLQASGGMFVAEVSSSRVRVRSEGAQLSIEGLANASVPRGSSWSSDPAAKDELQAPAQLVAALRSGSPGSLREVAMVRPAQTAAADPSAALLAQAHAQEGEKEYAAAAASYARLAGLGGAQAPAALYELARLRLKFLSQPQGALDALEQARSRYPANPLAQEVALSAIDARVALGHDDATMSELNLFLEKYSSSERAAEVRWLRASLEVRAGDCDAASGDLSRLAGDPVQGANALLGEAVCARRGGDEPAAKAALRGYLQRYPSGAHRREAQAAIAGGTLELP